MSVDSVFSGSIPEIYDTTLVPLIFEPYATDLASRVAALAPGSVLEIAAGSGAVTRAVVSLLPDMTRYVASDLNPAMLDMAKRRQPPDERVSFQQADALKLPFADASFDVVVCQFGVMFFPDKVAGLREARRVLRPDGRLLFNVWDRIEENEFTHVVLMEAMRMFPENPPTFIKRTPHGYFDLQRIEADVGAAGFTDVSLETLTLRSIAESPSDPAIGFCQGTPFRLELEALGPSAVQDVTERATKALAERFGEGEINGRIQAHVVVAGG